MPTAIKNVSTKRNSKKTLGEDVNRKSIQPFIASDKTMCVNNFFFVKTVDGGNTAIVYAAMRESVIIPNITDIFSYKYCHT